ncbi:MAG: hypothetical protein LBM04_12715 [Opitutaceae bacterium]|jgi:hypothetical protein|nr:hypothetical protein [Opitutaceae bacterium]
MKKLIAILCMLVAAVSLAWKLAGFAFTLQPSTTRTIVITNPDGSSGTQTVALGKLVTVTRLTAVEGTQFIVQNGTLETIGSGQFSMDTPLVATFNDILFWTSIALLFIAGLALYRTLAPKPPPAPIPVV